MRTPASVILTASLVLLDVGLATAQPPFRISFQRERDTASSIVLAGELSNDGARDVVDVWVTAEALDARGQVVGRGIAFVASLTPARRSTAFTVKLPLAAEARSFRLFVSSFRYGFGAESP